MRSNIVTFFKSFLIYGVSSVFGKIIPIILLPIIVKIMPNANYLGINDLLNAYSLFISFIILCGLNDAIARLYYENEDKNYKNSLISTTLYLNLLLFCIFFLLSILFLEKIQILIYGERNIIIYWLFLLMVLSNSIYFIFIQVLKMENYSKAFLKINIIAPIISYSFSIILLVNKYYIVALPVGFIMSKIAGSLYCWYITKDRYSFYFFDIKLVPKLLKIGVALMPTYLLFWGFSSIDRLMIANFLGNESVGIYGVAAKLAMISGIVNSAFTNVWQYFTFSNMKDKNHTNMISDFFKIIITLINAILAFAILFNEFLFSILFDKVYFIGSESFVYLFIAPLILILIQILSNQILLANKSYLNAPMLLIGGLLNIYFNYTLIPKIGIKGAAIGTFTGYFISLLLLILISNKLKILYIDKLCLINILIILLQLIMNECIIKSNIYLKILNLIIILLFTTIVISRYYRRNSNCIDRV